MKENLIVEKFLFPSLAELVDQAIHGDSSLSEYDRSSRRKGQLDEWYGTSSFEEAIELLNGWEEGRNKIAAFTHEYRNIFKAFFPTQEFQKIMNRNLEGATPDIDAFLKGEPDCMLDFTEELQEVQLVKGGKLQRMILNCGSNCTILPEVIFSRGALAGALINTLEEAGFQVEVNCIWSGTSDYSENLADYRQVIGCKIKDFNQILDIDRMAFVLAHSSMLRRFIFSIKELSPNSVKYIVPNAYGYPKDLPPEEITSYGVEKLQHNNMYFKLIQNNWKLEVMVEEFKAVLRETFTEVDINWKGPKE